MKPTVGRFGYGRAAALAVAALAALLAIACADAPSAVDNGVVRAQREGDGIRITNLTDEPRAYAAFDRNWLALVDAAPGQDLALIALCATQDAACLRLPAHGSVLVPFGEVGGYSASTKEVAVWTWRVVMNDANGQLQALPDDTIVLKL